LVVEVANVQYKEHEMTSVHSRGHSTVPCSQTSESTCMLEILLECSVFQSVEIWRR